MITAWETWNEYRSKDLWTELSILDTIQDFSCQLGMEQRLHLVETE